MGRRNEHSREELRDLALRAAGDIVAESGASALSMREVARRIGYTVGALYIVFENLDDLIVRLNEQTVIELREALERIRGRANQPAQNLRLLVAAYLGFALLNTSRWRLVFEHRLPEGQKAPASYAGHTAAIFALVGRHLREAGVVPAIRIHRRDCDRAVERGAWHLHARRHRQAATGHAGFGTASARCAARPFSAGATRCPDRGRAEPRDDAVMRTA